MRSSIERGARALLAAVALLAVPALHAQPAAGDVPGAAPTEQQIDAALDRLRADPNLVDERTIGALRWRESTPPASDGSGWGRMFRRIAEWIAGFFGWVAASARVVMWICVAVLVAMLAVYVTRLARRFSPPTRAERFVAPSHVLDLDIRPESLPDDVGAAAAALWERGDRRAALALLYRGSLSRLVHAYGVPIRDSSTEGDCLALAAPRLTIERNGYVRRLIGVWQAAVYGGLEPDTLTARSLCGGFAAALDPPAPAATESARTRTA